MYLNEILHGLDDGVPPRVAVLDDDRSSVLVIDRLLMHGGYRVSAFTEPDRFLASIGEHEPDAICLDLHVPGYEDVGILEAVRKQVPGVPVIMLTADDHPASVVASMRAGAFDYVTKPVDRERLLLTVGHAVKQRRLAQRLHSLEHPAEGRRFANVFGRSTAMLELFRQLDGATGSDVPVLLQGEVGTGKARLARAIHARSGRRNHPFVEVNLSTTPEPVQAASLFGYSRNASRESASSRRGLLDQANGGTLLLRDVGELGPVAQAGLLRLLERGAFLRVGGGADVPCDIRLIASTSRDLSAEVAAGRFREALYFRMAVFDLRVPPLRERQDDIVPLAAELLREHGSAVGVSQNEPVLNPGAVDALLAYGWPGNVRELSNAVQRAAIASGGRPVEASDLPAYVRPGATVAPSAPIPLFSQELPVETLESLERRAILAAMARHRGNAAAVARELDIGRATLYRKLKQYDFGAAAQV